ncbi:MAG: sn-glycerol-3-phosphate ABC transporter ATP-binding protein UgpC, partial [Oscillospiraceae bacterium]|nr:sn-glycerol-3-phosphate ABC transporter ATP-binding protein UgpC [Oscillospiraceae bacterium]
MASLLLKGIYKKYPGGVIAVSDFNLEIKDKEFIILVGPSGCGKTTTLRMIAGLEEITEGECFIGDRIVNDVAPKDRDIAMVFQNYALYPHMSVFDNMAFGLKLRKTPKDEIRRRVEEAARILDIAHLLDRKPKALSGGQRQRVALGRAIVREPKVFLLDEPLSNLDAKLRAQMRTELAKLHAKLGTTFIYVTHDQTEAMTMGDRIVVMKDGFIQQVDSPQTLYSLPVNMFVAGFIGSPMMNFVDSKLLKKDGVFYVEFGTEDTKSTRGTKYQIPLPAEKNKDGVLDAYVDKEIIMGIRPEDVHDEARLLEEF